METIILLKKIQKILDNHSHLLAVGYSWGIPEDVFENVEKDLLALFNEREQEIKQNITQKSLVE